MDFSEILDEICCDERIKTGTPDLTDPEFCFVLQEYLIKNGLDINEVVDKTGILFEKGRFPERQAYNADGILVTFPTKEYRDRAVDKGTHFAENPKKAQSNIFTDLKSNNGLSVADIEKKDNDNVELSTNEDDFISIDDYIKTSGDLDTRSEEQTEEDSKMVSNILSSEFDDPEDVVFNDQNSLEEISNYLKESGFIKSGNVWKDENGTLIAEQYFDENSQTNLIKLNEKENKLSISKIPSMNYQQLIIVGKVGETTGLTGFSENLKRMGKTMLDSGLSFSDFSDLDGLNNLEDFVNTSQSFFDIPKNVIQWFGRLISLKKNNPSLNINEVSALFDSSKTPFTSVQKSKKSTKKSDKTSTSRGSSTTYKKLMDDLTRGSDATLRTSVYEAIPILKIMGVDVDDIDTENGQNKILELLRHEEFQKLTVDWFKKLITTKKRNPNLTLEDYKQLFNTLAGNKIVEDGEEIEKTLKSINGEIDTFLHLQVQKYKQILRKKTNTDDGSKENTADIVLVYGTDDSDEFLNKLENIKSEQDLSFDDKGVITIKGTGISFCQVSLKAGKGRVGKVGKKFGSMFGVAKDIFEEDRSTFINEGLSSTVSSFIDFIKNKTSFLSDNAKKMYNYFIQRLSSFSESLLNVFRKMDISYIRARDKKLETLTDELNSEFENVSDTTDSQQLDKTTNVAVKDDNETDGENKETINEYDFFINESPDGKIEITDCYYRTFKSFYNTIKSYNFSNLISSLSSFVEKNHNKKVGDILLSVDDLNKEENEKILASLEEINKIFEDAITNISDVDSVDEGKIKCKGTGKYITREQISPALKLRANFISLNLLHELFKKCFQNKNQLSDNERFISEVAAQFAAEALFGDNLGLPLYKFTGKSLTYLGLKKDYVELKKNEIEKLQSENKMPIAILKVNSVRGSDVHFSINLYLLHDFIVTKNGVEPEYFEFTFNVGSGSKFTHNVESNKVVSYRTMKKKFPI